VVPPRFQSEDAQDYGQGKERFGAGDGTKNTGFRLALGKAHPGKTEPRSTKQGEQQTNNSGERSRPLLPAYAGIEGVLLLLVERFRRDDRAEAASSPGGSGGAWNLDVTGDDLGATTNDLFAKAMVIGPACPRQDCCDYCHLANIAHQPSKTSMIFSMPLLRTLEFGMSAFTAARTRSCERRFPSWFGSQNGLDAELRPIGPSQVTAAVALRERLDTQPAAYLY
jgi:hypothetical protein